MLRAMLVCAGFVVAGLVWAAQPGPASAPSERLLPAQGTLVEVDGRDLLVAPASMGGRGAIVEEVRVRTDDNTDLRIDLQPGSKLADLEPGMNLFLNSSRPDRLVILAFTAPKWGTVVKLEGHRLILNVAPRGRPDREVEVATDENTKVMILGVANDPGGFAQLSDLRPDNARERALSNRYCGCDRRVSRTGPSPSQHHAGISAGRLGWWCQRQGGADRRKQPGRRGPAARSHHSGRHGGHR